MQQQQQIRMKKMNNYRFRPAGQRLAGRLEASRPACRPAGRLAGRLAVPYRTVPYYTSFYYYTSFTTIQACTTIQAFPIIQAFTIIRAFNTKQAFTRTGILLRRLNKYTYSTQKQHPPSTSTHTIQAFTINRLCILYKLLPSIGL